MGMDLIGAQLSYNWSGWEWLVEKLDEWGVDVSEFRFSNDGDLISKETCIKVAQAIEEHLDELDYEFQEWLEPHIFHWRECGGCRQY